jgi:NAD(P)-dependent dehydrogenase (short-subunit alcohol dehydrogenase family)
VVVPIQCDVTDQASVTKVVDQVKQEVGYLDVLINNSGVNGPTNTGIYAAKSVEELRDELLNDWHLWDSTFAVNVAAVCGMSAQFLPLLEKGNERRGWQTGRLAAGEERTRSTKAIAADVDESDTRTSQIITTSSISAFNRHVTAGIAYTTSKAGATMLGKAMATFLAPFGIRSNVIAPGSRSMLRFNDQTKLSPLHSLPFGDDNTQT